MRKRHRVGRRVLRKRSRWIGHNGYVNASALGLGAGHWPPVIQAAGPRGSRLAFSRKGWSGNAYEYRHANLHLFVAAE